MNPGFPDFADRGVFDVSFPFGVAAPDPLGVLLRFPLLVVSSFILGELLAVVAAKAC